MVSKVQTDPELIKKFLQDGGKVKVGHTHTLKRNLVYNSGNHHKLAKLQEPETVKDTWERRRRSK